MQSDIYSGVTAAAGNLHGFCFPVAFMHDSDFPFDGEIDIQHLRQQASAALNGCRQVGNAIRLYERYLELSRDYRVKMVGPFLVIEGGLAKNPADLVA